MHKMFLTTRLIIFPFLSAVILSTGCSTIIDARKQKQPYIASYYSGNLNKAAEDLTGKSENRRDSDDELMWRLDQGTAQFTAGEYQQSVNTFKRCETIISDYDNRAVISARAGAAEAGSALTNANALPYKGMYLDRVMLNAYKALGYFALGAPSGAQVELRRMRYAQKRVVQQFNEEIRQNQQEIDAQNQKNQHKSTQNTSMSFNDIAKNPIIDKVYKTSANKANKLYGNLSNPFVSYFSAIGYLIENNYAEALVDFRNLYKMLPDNKLVQQDYVSCARKIGAVIPEELSHIEAYPYPLDRKMAYVLLFNGRAPALKQEKFQMILPYVGYTGIAFPRYEYFSSALQGLNIDYLYQQKSLSVQTEQVANFDAIMSHEYHQKLPGMITRLVISTLTKEMASYAAVHAAKQAGTGAQIGALILTGLYKAMFNTADTRCWETLPQEIQIAHIPIPDNGILQITPIGAGKTTEIKLKNDTNNAIVFIRALSANKLIYKVFEIQ